jgi:hypothetical protein
MQTRYSRSTVAAVAAADEGAGCAAGELREWTADGSRHLLRRRRGSKTYPARDRVPRLWSSVVVGRRPHRLIDDGLLIRVGTSWKSETLLGEYDKHCAYVGVLNDVGAVGRGDQR